MALLLLAPHAHIAWRDDRTLVLEDPAAPDAQVQVANAVPSLVRWLRGCNGTRTLAQVLASARRQGIDPEAARELLDLLVDTGLLTLDAPDAGLGHELPPEALSPLRQDLEALALSGRAAERTLRLRRDHHVYIEGGNRVAHALVDVLAASHIGGLTVRGQHISRRPVALRDVSPFGPASQDVGSTPSLALRRHIERALPSPAATHRAVALLCDTHLDPGDELAYQALRMPYLRVLTTSRYATIGPLTLPGHTVCWSCIALHRSDRDPHWPHVLAQFDQQRRDSAPVDSAFAMRVASEAADQLLRVIDLEDPSALVNRTLHIDRADGSLRRRQWRVHPDCPCQWRQDAAA